MSEPRKNKKLFTICGIVGIIVIVAIGVFYGYTVRKGKQDKLYLEAMDYYNQQQYQEALEKAEKIADNYDGKEKLVNEITYCLANQYLDESAYEEADKLLQKIPDYEDVPRLMKRVTYYKGVNEYMLGNYEKAEELLSQVEDYGDTANYLKEISMKRIMEVINNGDYETAQKYFDRIAAYEPAASIAAEAGGKLGLHYYEEGRYEDARSCYEKISQAEGSQAQLQLIEQESLAADCVKELLSRYTGEVQITQIDEIRSAMQNYSDTLKIPITMIRFHTGETQKYAVYDSDTYLAECHSLNKNDLDMSNPDETTAYLKLSKNWESTETAMLGMHRIKSALSMEGVTIQIQE